MVWAGIILALGSYSLFRIVPDLVEGKDQIDFSTFYLAGRMVVVNPNQIYSVSEMEAFDNQSNQDPSQLPYKVTEWAPGFAYPPFFAVVMSLLSLLPFKQASLIWEGMNAVCFLMSIPLLLILSGWKARKEGGWIPLVLGILAVILFSPAQEVLMLGQITLLLLILTTISLVLLQRGSTKLDLLAGLLIGLATGIKIFPALLLIYLIIRRRWYAVIGGIVAFLISILIGIIGTGGWQNGVTLTWNYFTINLFETYLNRLDYFQLGNQALSVFFLRIFGKNLFTQILGNGSSLVIFIITVWILFKRRSFPLESRIYQLELATVSILPLIIMPWVPSNFCSLALPALAILMGDYACLRQRFSLMRFQILGIIYLMMIISSYEDWLKFPIFRYIPAGLIGILILWVLVITRSRTNCQLLSQNLKL